MGQSLCWRGIGPCVCVSPFWTFVLTGDPDVAVLCGMDEPLALANHIGFPEAESMGLGGYLRNRKPR